MSNIQSLSTLIKRNNDMLKRHLSDFSDADLLVRPVEGANHAAWQLLHTLKSSVGVANAIAPGVPIAFPAKYAEISTKAGAVSDDPAQFPGKDELFQHLDSFHAAFRSALDGMTDEQLSVPSPEKFRGYAATLFELVLMVPLHTGMHVGQIQVIRRKLKKPVLF